MLRRFLAPSDRATAAYDSTDAKDEGQVISLSLEGTAYEIGRQHGKSLQGLIHSALESQSLLSAPNAHESSAALKRRAQSVAARFPNLMREIEGIADGTGLPLEAVLHYNLSPLPSACSNVAFLSDDGPLLGHVNDDTECRFDVAFRVRPGIGRELLHVGVAGSAGTGAALNSAGLAISHACARSAGLRNSEAHFNLPLLRRALIDACGDCGEARAFLLDHHFGSGADNIIAIDRSGGAFVSEKLPTAVAFRESQGDAIYCTGRPLDQDIRRLVSQETYEQEAPEVQKLIGRERYFQAVTSRNKGRLSVELMKEILSCTEEGVAVCNELSNWAAILLPRQFQALVAGRPPSKESFEPLRA